MTRNDISEVSYDTSIILSEAEYKVGRIDERTMRNRCERTECARSLMHKIDDILSMKDKEKIEAQLWEINDNGKKMMNSTICDKKNLDWDAGSIISNLPRIAVALFKSVIR